MTKEQAFKILVPTDSSPSSIIAEEMTTSLAKKLNAKVTILHVVTHELMRPAVQKFFIERHQHVPVGVYQESPLYLHASPAPEKLSEEVMNEIDEAYRQKAEEVVNEAATTFKNEGIPVEKKIVRNADAAEAIIKEAKQGDYNIIVLGHRPAGQMPILRGVAEKVSRHAETPVLIARGEEKISRILVPLDGSENSTRALQYAAMLSKKTDAKITLLHVQEEGFFKLKPELSKQLGVGILTVAAEQVKDVKVDKEMKLGDPAKVIVETATSGKHHIVVMGSKGHSALDRFLLGSVSDHVIHYTDSSVLLVR